MKYSSKDIESLTALSKRIERLTLEALRWLHFNCYARQLMTNEQLDDIARKFKNIPQATLDAAFRQAFNAASEEDVQELTEDLVKWIVAGDDLTDPESVGGFNQTEIDALVAITTLAEDVHE